MAMLSKAIFEKLLNARRAFEAETGRCPRKATLSLQDAYEARQLDTAHIQGPNGILGYAQGLNIYAGTHDGDPILE